MEIEPADRAPEEIQSLCMNCESENGTTRLLLTRIPYFRDVVIMSFYCPDCHYKNNEIENAGEIQQRGVKIRFRGETLDDLQRQVIKGDKCTVRFEEIDLEIPPGKGRLTNFEGLLSAVASDLSLNQAEREAADPALAAKLRGVISSLQAVIDGESFPFTISFDDPTGNSSVEPSPADRSGKYTRQEYPRSAEQNAALGLAPQSEESPDDAPPPSTVRPEYKSRQLYPEPPPDTAPHNVDTLGDEGAEDEDEDIEERKVYSIPQPCPGCSKPTTQNMQMVRIPHFEEVVIMAISCDACGYKDSEVKTGGAVPAKGRRITLQIKTREDLSRDILKSQHCEVDCPELRLNVQPGTLGGRFTTVEGLLTNMRDDLKASIFDIGDDGVAQKSDSMPAQEKASWDHFFDQIDRAINAEVQFTIILSDPTAKSYVQSFTAPEPDSQITVEDYERTEQEEEDLGIRDMQTEGYEGDPNLENGKLEEVVEAQEKLQPKEIDLEEVQREVRARLLNLAEDGVDDGLGNKES